jgi:NAD(P)-dependent dehydrogenase (short-subunit alcohol dehydrogenase family)
MDIAGSVALVTGANGGIGRAFVAELLKRGAAKIYFAARDPASLSEMLNAGDARVVVLMPGALSHSAYQAFTADPRAFQAKMSTRLPPTRPAK